MQSKIVIFWNAGAGTAAKGEQLREKLSAEVKHIDLSDVTDLVEAVRIEANDPDSTLVAAGGDGTVSALGAAMVLAGVQARLGILPLGTGNDLARTLDIPFDLEEAWSLILTGNAKAVDVIEFLAEGGKGILLNVATGGLSTRVSKENKGKAKSFFGALSYLVKAMRTVFDRKRFWVTLTFADRVFRMKAANLIVANGRFVGGGSEVAPYASVQDGLMDVIVVKHFETLDLIRLSAKFIAGDYIEDDRVFFAKTSHVNIQSTPNFTLSTDGETRYKTPVTFTCKAGALQVIGRI